MEKEIHIFDTRNQILKVSGIRFELFEVNSGALLATDITHDLGGAEWGVRLRFKATNGPLEVYTTDPNHRYPGNVIKNLEGKNSNRIDIDLGPVPVVPGGQSAPLQTTAARAVFDWVQSSPNWSEEEKGIVRNLIFNYVKLSGDIDAAKEKEGLAAIMADWEKALEQLGVKFWISSFVAASDVITGGMRDAGRLLNQWDDLDKYDDPEVGA